jgi:AraC-like DNA-binding protein
MFARIENIEMIIQQANHGQVNRSWSKSNFPYPHNRIYYITEGEAELKLIDQVITLKKGCLYLLPAFLMVESKCRQSMTHHYIHFQMKKSYTDIIYENMKPKLEVEGKDEEETLKFFEMVEKNYDRKDLGSLLKAHGALQIMLSYFFEEQQVENNEIKRFIPVMEYIEIHLAQSMSIDELAALLELNPVYFSNLFAKTFGLPPRKYINKKRLELAQVLLMNTNKKVKDIAFEVGFDDDMYFSKYFHHNLGTSPGEYRKQSRFVGKHQ